MQEGGLVLLAPPAARVWNLFNRSCFKTFLPQKAGDTTVPQVPPPTLASNSPREPGSPSWVGDGLAGEMAPGLLPGRMSSGAVHAQSLVHRPS